MKAEITFLDMLQQKRTTNEETPHRNALTDILLYFGNTESEDFSRLILSIGEEKFMEIARILPDASYSLSKR